MGNEMIGTIAIADCKECTTVKDLQGDTILVKGYWGVDGKYYYGRVVSTGEPISNCMYRVFGEWNN